MYRRCQPEQEGPAAVQPRAEQTCDEDDEGQADDAVGEWRAHQEDGVEGTGIGEAADEEQQRGADRQQRATAERKGEHRQRLEAQHAQDASHQFRELDLG